MPFVGRDVSADGLRPDLATNPPLVQFLLGLREKLEDGARPFLAREPGFD